MQDGGRPAEVAGEVESALLKWGGGVTAKYKARFRTISFNLKDAANPDLRRRLLSREILPDVRSRLCPDLPPAPLQSAASACEAMPA